MEPSLHLSILRVSAVLQVGVVFDDGLSLAVPLMVVIVPLSLADPAAGVVFP